ncbi:unnamed protein product [Ectocarpus sp. 4 AP-2014]
MAHALRTGLLGVASRGTVRNFSAWLALALVALIAGVCDAFVAPSASLPLAGGSAVSKIDEHSRGCSTRPNSGGSGSLSMSADGSATKGEPAKLAAVLYTYVDGMVDKRGPYRTDHLDLLKAMTEEGTCLLGGAFLEPCDGAVLLFSSPEKAQQFVDKDPYNTGGLVTKYQIRDYMAVVGTMLK